MSTTSRKGARWLENRPFGGEMTRLKCDDHVVRDEGLPVVPQDALPKVERDRPAVLADFPPLRQLRPQRPVLRLRVHAHELRVDGRDKVQRGNGRVLHRVEPRRVRRVGAHQHAAVDNLVARRRRCAASSPPPQASATARATAKIARANGRVPTLSRLIRTGTP